MLKKIISRVLSPIQSNKATTALDHADDVHDFDADGFDDDTENTAVTPVKPSKSTKLSSQVASSKAAKTKTKTKTGTAIRYGLEEHGIESNLLSRAALEVCDGLHDAGFEAFVVGGAVRDMLLAREPKDFDIATNATPEQVVRVFRRSRIIGKRFRIVHVMVGRELIEVTTFRADKDGDDKTDAHGRVLTDNTYGTIVTDAARRDLTVNALYYDPSTEQVWDFHDGMSDLKQRNLRMIGDPATRYREDPVRMLRVARFAAKLDFAIDEASFQPIVALKSLVSNCPPSRLFDEVQKLLMSGYAVRTLDTLRRLKLSQGLLPVMDMVLAHPEGEAFVRLALESTDERVNEGKSTTPSFLFASLLWYEVLAKAKALVAAGEKPFPAREQAMNHVLAVQCETLAIPRRFTTDMCDIWAMQLRFEQATKRNLTTLMHPRFRAGYDFFLLRCDAGEQPEALGVLWTTMHLAQTREEVAELLEEYLATASPAEQALAAEKPKKRRRKPSKPKTDA
jgi:poly(A) polymerase